ncbi:MORN repeat-containing protein [Aureococcus anophagefferens]|uniref:MORN repeat-containing protein n=2 Tax=Aureococcus anophagefferens TaxID=44056 RepID=A0ABR1FTS6_AURAN
MDDEEEMQTEESKRLAAEAKVAKEKAEKEAEERKQAIYKTLMRRANIENRRKHLGHLADLDASRREPTGRVSRKIYHELVSVRKFDHARSAAARRPRRDARAPAAAGDAAKEAQAVQPLVTPKWVIGYKKEQFGPPGLAPPRNGVLNSEGNEHFYSYDGLWEAGRMHGFGRYKFADGMLYSGGFKNGLPDGEGSAWYPGGTKYKGHWRDGLHEGTGVMTYATGSTYDGYWKDGKRQGEGKLTFASGTVYEGHFWLGKYHGRGRVTSPTTGFEFVGSFHRGFVNGPGALVWPDGERDTRNWASYGGMTLKQLIEYALQEKAEKAAKKTKERDAAFSVRLAVRLQDYVTSVRDDINAEREEKKIEAEATRRALVQERKEKARELREKALASLSAAADEATGAEADANFDAAAEI